MVRLWDARTGELRKTLQSRLLSAAMIQPLFSNDGALLATAGILEGSEGFCVQIWDTNNGYCRGTYIQNQDVWITLRAFSPDGKLLLGEESGLPARAPAPRYIPSMGSTADAGTPTTPSVRHLTVWDATDGRVVRRLPVNAYAFRKAAVLPGGRSVALTVIRRDQATGKTLGEIQIVNLRSGKLERVAVKGNPRMAPIGLTVDGSRAYFLEFAIDLPDTSSVRPTRARQWPSGTCAVGAACDRGRWAHCWVLLCVAWLVADQSTCRATAAPWSPATTTATSM
jgi:hypothetical protein